MSLSCSTFNLLLFLPCGLHALVNLGEFCHLYFRFFSCGILLLVENTGEGKIKLTEPCF